MATIKTAISLYDGMSRPLQAMSRGVSTLVNVMETAQGTFDHSFDPTVLQQVREDIAEATVAFDQMEQQINQTDSAQDRFNSSIREGSTAAGGLLGQIKNIAVAMGGLTAVKKLVELSDDMSSTTARLNLIVDDGGSVEALEAKIMDSAQRSRASYLTTAKAVSQMGLMAGDAFANNDELIAFTEILNKQFAIAGTDATGAEAATLQLTQALASGVLRGEELNSVFEQAPNVIQSIADYLGVPLGEIRSMAAEGQITADIVKNAMFAAADEVNAKFETIPITWEQLGTTVANTLLQTFDPVIQAIGRGAQFIYDNWATLEPIFWGLAAAVGAYAVALGVQTAATWIANGAAKAFFTTLLSNPLFWIALAVGVVVGAIYKWVQSVGGLQVAWLICCNALLTAWDWVKIGFFTGIYWVLDLWDKLKLGIMSAGVAIQNFMGDMKAGVLMILQNMVNSAIGIINDFISVLNTLPGVSIDLIAEVTFGTTAQLENAAAQAARNADLEAYRSEIESNIANRDAALEQMKSDARAATAEREANIAAVQAEALAQQSGADSMGLETTWDGIYSNTADTAENTANACDALTYAEEDLAYMRDIAEREAINRFTTAEIHVDMGGVTNNLASGMDLDGVLDAFGERLAEEIEVHMEGVSA